MLEIQGEENNRSDRVFIARDDATIEARDKVTIDSVTYVVDEVKRIDPIENTLLALRVTLSQDARYT